MDLEMVSSDLQTILNAFEELEKSQSLRDLLILIKSLVDEMSGSESAYELNIIERVDTMKGENGKSMLEMIIE
jgi:hypothetical protein